MFHLVSLLVLAFGLVLVRTAPASARWLAWCVGIGFAIVGTGAMQVGFEAVAARHADAALGTSSEMARTAVLRAAAAAGPRALDLVLRWQDELPAAVAAGPLGAIAAAPPPLPFAPGQLQVRCLGTASVRRPIVLQVESPVLAASLPVEVTVRVGADVVHRETVMLGAGAATEFPFTPKVVGTHQIEIAADLAGHRLRGVGSFAVGDAATVLVVEPSGTIADALAAQGVAVVRAPGLPADFRKHAALVIGAPLTAEQQALVATAVEDGLGLFVLAPAFGGEHEPWQGLLPLRLLPAAAAKGDADAGAGDRQPDPTLPPTTPDQPEQPDKPPAGDTDGAGPLSKDPIEVDKHAIAMVLVVDRSGSMGNTLPSGATKMSYAKTSALRTAQALDLGDQVAVVTFGNKNDGRVELPMTPATDVAKVRAGIDKLNFGPEYTYLLGGLRKGYEMLQGVHAAVKHIVVISDGEFDLSEELALRAAAHRMRVEGKMSLSIISIVSDSSMPQFESVATELATDGGGMFFATKDAASVPALVSGEVTRALQSVGRTPRRGNGANPAVPPTPSKPPPQPKPKPPEPPPPAPRPDAPRRLQVVAVADSQLLAPEPKPSWPTLGGARAGIATLDAQVLLAIANDAGWPLLIFANRGLGRVGAFAADLAGADGFEFRRDVDFPARLAQWVASVLPAQANVSPRPLLQTVEVTPRAPTPHEMQQLTQLAGMAPVLPDAVPSPTSTWRRVLAGKTSERARWLLLAVLVLALGERALTAWTLRRRAA